MKRVTPLLLAVAALPAFAAQNYRTDAHAQYDTQGNIEISSQLVYARPASPPPAAAPVSPAAPVTVMLPASQLFTTNSATLLAPSDALQALARRLRTSATGTTVEITGYTDNTGSRSYNQKLSVSRAKSIQRYLVPFNGSLHYIARGRGESAPVASNRTPAGREQNRRVVVIIEGGK